MTDAEAKQLKADVESLRVVSGALINAMRYVLAENERADAHRRQALRRFLTIVNPDAVP